MDKRFLVCVENNNSKHAEKLMLSILESLDPSAIISHKQSMPNLFLVLSGEIEYTDILKAGEIVNAEVKVCQLPAKSMAIHIDNIPEKFKSYFNVSL
jgi:hypothetical protein